MCEVCPQVQPQAGGEGPTLRRADEAESLVKMDNGEVEIIMEEVVESKENVMNQQQRPREKMNGRFGALLSELELIVMSTPFVPQSTKCTTLWSVNLFKAWVKQLVLTKAQQCYCLSDARSTLQCGLSTGKLKLAIILVTESST